MIRPARFLLEDIIVKSGGNRGMKKFLRLVADLVKRDLYGRYAGLGLGSLWVVLHPLLMIVIFSVIFSRLVEVRSGGLAGMYGYVVYLCSGLLVWICVENALKDVSRVFLDNSDLVKKSAFPRSALVWQAVVSGHVQFLAALFVFMCFLLLLGHFPGISFFVFFPLILFVQFVFLLGLGGIFAPVSVYVRDVPEGLTVVLTLLFWLTPVVYPEDTISGGYAFLLNINPAVPLVRIYHALLFERVFPDTFDLVLFSVYAVVSACVGTFAYRKLIREIADHV